MPNWCENNLIINGSKKNLEKFYNENRNEEKDENLDFYKSIPMPESVYNGNIGIEERKRYGSNNWYDFNVQNLGTKWNVSDADYYLIEKVNKKDAFNTIKTIYLKTTEKGKSLQLGCILKKFFIEHEAIYNFLTAWSPPINWLVETSKKYPDLKFSINYIEHGCDFRGTEIYQNGKNIYRLITSVNEYIYQNNKKEIQDLIKKYINNKKSLEPELWNNLTIESLCNKLDEDGEIHDLLEEIIYLEKDLLNIILQEMKII